MSASPPREIPRGLSRQVTSPGDGLIYGGGLMAVCGLGASTVLALDPYGPPGWLFVALAAGALFVGVALLFLALRYRSHKLRTLRNGRLLRGHVASIDSTNVLINGDRRHLVKVRFRHQGREHIGICPLHGSDVDGAKALAESGDATRILVDSGDPTRVLCPEFLWIDDASPATVVRRD